MKESNALAIHPMRFVLGLILDCFISLKKEKVAFLIFDGGSLVGRRSLARWDLCNESKELSKRGQSSLG